MSSPPAPAPKPSSHFCFLQPDGCERVLPADEARSAYNVDGFLRAGQDEHARTPGLTSFWYFNLGPTTHQLGHVYGMTPVLRPGRRATETEPEVLPLLGGEGRRRYRCAELLWYPQFPACLGAEVLRNSLLHDKTLQGLQQALMRRYAPAQSALDETAVLARGLTATLLESLD